MSGIKPPAMHDFYRSLRARGMTTERLAESIGLSGGAVRRVLCGIRRRGPIWLKLEPLLTDTEKLLLKDVEQCATWNTRQVLKRPKWSADKAKAFSHAA